MDWNVKRIYHLSHRTLLVIGLGFSLLSGNVAYAQGKGAPGQESEVDKHYNAGVAIAESATKKDDWEKACNEFEQAFKLEPSPQIAANLGHAEYRAGHMRAATEHLDYFLRKDKEASPEAKSEIVGFLTKAREHVVTVAVTVDQVGAEIVVNGVVKGVSPLAAPIFLEPGIIDITARKTGMRAEPQMYTFTKGDRADVTIKMAVDAGASVAPKKKVEKRGKDPKWQTGWAVGAGIFGLVGVGIGVTFIFVANDYGKKSATPLVSLQSDTPEHMSVCDYAVNYDACAANRRRSKTADKFLYAGIPSLLAGTAALAGMIALISTSGKHEKAIQVKPVMNHSQLGLLIDGRF